MRCLRAQEDDIRQKQEDRDDRRERDRRQQHEEEKEKEKGRRPIKEQAPSHHAHIAIPSAQPILPSMQPMILGGGRPHLPSSPISRIHDDSEVLNTFFDWKVENERQERKGKWESARRVVKTNDWSVSDLKEIEADKGAMYERAISAGISDGFARRFSSELRAFKVAWRASEEA